MPKTFKTELTLDFPDNVSAQLDDKVITVKGKKGTIVKDFNHIKNVEISIENKTLKLVSYFPRKATVAKMGTLKSIVQNAIIGVTDGYRYRMKIAYSHFPITVEVSGEKILIKNFLGERSPRITYKAGKEIEIKADKEDVEVSGIDKELVGQTAANIQKRCRIRQKDKRVFQDGIYCYEKYSGNEIIWKLKY